MRLAGKLVCFSLDWIVWISVRVDCSEFDFDCSRIVLFDWIVSVVVLVVIFGCVLKIIFSMLIGMWIWLIFMLLGVFYCLIILLSGLFWVVICFIVVVIVFNCVLLSIK